MNRLVLALVCGLLFDGVALILWGIEEDCPAVEKCGLELVKEAIEEV